MKRLIKKASNKTLYHATSIESLRGIITAGELRPQEVTQSGWAKIENVDRYFDGNLEEYHKHMDNYIGYTFFGTYEESVKEYGARAAVQSGLSDIYAIITAEISEDLLLPDLNDAPNAKTWKESEEQVGQVCVLGSVPVSQMTELTLILRNLYYRISTNFESWEDDLKNFLKNELEKNKIRDYDYEELLEKLKIQP